MRMCASAHWSVGSLRAKTVVRSEIETYSLSSMLRKERSLCLVPSSFPCQRPITRIKKMVYLLSSVMAQLQPVMALSLVLPFGLP